MLLTIYIRVKEKDEQTYVEANAYRFTHGGSKFGTGSIHAHSRCLLQPGLEKVETAVLDALSSKGSADYVIEMAEHADLSKA